MEYVLLSISILVALFAGTARKLFSDGKYATNAFRYFYTATTAAISTIGLLLIGGIPTASCFTVAIGLIYGVAIALQAIFQLKAYETGPFSYTTLIITLSTIIPALSGYLFFGEDISFGQIIGIVLFVVCVFLSVDGKKQKKASKKWLIYTLLAMLCTGAMGLLQKWHQSSEYAGELDGFLVLGFLAAVLISTAAILIPGGRMTRLLELRSFLDTKTVIILLASGIFVAANHKLNLYLSGVIESVVFFPAVNGSNLILTILISLLYFKEKLSKKQWAGIATGIASLAFLIFEF